jgi:hypothetical protein
MVVNDTFLPSFRPSSLLSVLLPFSPVLLSFRLSFFSPPPPPFPYVCPSFLPIPLPSVFPPFRPSVRLPVRPSVFSSFPSARPSVYPSVRPSASVLPFQCRSQTTRSGCSSRIIGGSVQLLKCCVFQPTVC